MVSKYGEVSSAKIITDRETAKSRGFGFVELSDEAAHAAIKAFNDGELEGRSITVKEAEDRPQCSGGGGGGNRGGFRPEGSERPNKW